MRPPDAVYHGDRVRASGPVHVVMKPDKRSRWQPLTSSPLCRLNPSIGFEWGYCGAGPLQLALAILFDATGDAGLARRAHEWFMRAAVSQWRHRWSITAAQVHAWVDQWQSETRPHDLRDRMRDPAYTPTVAEALADPDGFVAGMEEIEVHIRTDAEGGDS